MTLTTRAVLDGIGVNVHWQNASGPTASAATVAYDLGRLGVSAIRGRAPPAASDVAYGYATRKLGALLGSSKVKTFSMVVNSAADVPIGIGDQLASIKALMAAYPAVRYRLEGPNEPQNWPIRYAGLADVKGGPFPASAKFTADLFAAARADPALDDLMLATPSWDATPAEALSCDLANQHAYPSCDGPAAGVAGAFVAAKIGPTLAPYGDGKPAIVTELGISSAPHGGGMSVDAPTQAKLILNLLFQVFRQGVSEGYIYSLYDDSGNLGTTSFGDVCGLFDFYRNRKPAFDAVSAVMTHLAGAVAVTKPDAAVFAEPAGAYLLPMQRAADAWDIAVWNEPVIWAPKTRAAITPKPAAVALALPFAASAVSVFDPIAKTTAALTPSARVAVTLQGYPLIVRVSK